MGSHVSDDDNDRTELLVAKSEKGSVNHSPRGGGDGNIGVVAESPTAAAPVGGEEVAKAEGKLDLLTPVLDCLKFLGLMGLYTSIPVAPCVWLLDVTEVEVFVNPFIDCQGISCFSYMIIDGCLDMAYNIGLLLGISLTSPRFMSAGTIMIIPVGVIVDAIQYVVVVITAAAVVVFVVQRLNYQRVVVFEWGQVGAHSDTFRRGGLLCVLRSVEHNEVLVNHPHDHLKQHAQAEVRRAAQSQHPPVVGELVRVELRKHGDAAGNRHHNELDISPECALVVTRFFEHLEHGIVEEPAHFDRVAGVDGQGGHHCRSEWCAEVT